MACLILAVTTSHAAFTIAHFNICGLVYPVPFEMHLELEENQIEAVSVM
jgi:hypothetical protein